jgi:hypothetical protein
MPEDPLHHAEREMAAYELDALSALFAKLAARAGLDTAHPASEERLQAELSALIDEDAEAAELARTLLTLKAPLGLAGPAPGRPASLGEEEDMADGEAVYAVVEACRSTIDRGRARSGSSRLLREAIWIVWEQPRLPRTLLDGKLPLRYPWSPSARGTVATQSRRPQGLVVGHLYSHSQLANDLLEQDNDSPAATVRLLRERIVSAVLTRQEDRLVSALAGMPWEAHEADPWCRCRLALGVEDFAVMEEDE